MPWAALQSLIEPHYPTAGNGRPLRLIQTMLRMCCISSWFNLADMACEDAVYDVAALRGFLPRAVCCRGVPAWVLIREEFQSLQSK